MSKYRSKKKRLPMVVSCIALMTVAVISIWHYREPLPEKPVIGDGNAVLSVNLTATQIQEMSDYFHQILKQEVQPYHPENAYWPDQLKERLAWASKNTSLQVAGKINNADGSSKPDSSIWANTKDSDGHLWIVVKANYIYKIWLANKGQLPLSRQSRNEFATYIAHEVEHIRGNTSGENLKGEAYLAEEWRTVSQIDKLIVTPLLQMNEPVDIDLLRYHFILEQCRYKRPCPDFDEQIVIGAGLER